ncbi:MAG TPA: amidase [Actinomycetota bacterium]|nr:amidase [Actinomycetota bacterium]
MTESLATRAMRDAVSLVRSRRLKAPQFPALEFRPQPRASGPARLSPAKEPAQGPIGKAGQRLRAGETSCKELLEESLAAIERDNQRLNAFAEVTEDMARDRALALDEELATGRLRGPMHGIPISVKDVIDVAGVPTRAGSAAYHDVPAGDAPPVGLLKDAGAVLLGKATTHEFALGAVTPQSRNPHNPARIPGGSSGGSAIAVATGMGLGSLGTDTRGSARIPAALSGVVGFKPTYGSVPAGGIVQVSWSMDHLAPIASSVPDAALILDVLASSGTAGYAGSDVWGLRLGTPPDACTDADYGILASFTSALQLLGQLAGRVVEVSRPATLDFSNAASAALVVSRCEAAAYHRRLGLDRSKFWPEVRNQLDAAEEVTAVDYLDAQRLRAVLAEAMVRVFEQIDVLVLPTSLVPAPALEEAGDYLALISRNAIPWSFIGFPAISVPCGKTAAGLPVGLQMVAPPFEEASLVALGSAFESARR